MSNLTELNENNFDDEVIKSDKLTVVDFWAPWCGPCRKLSPVLDEIAGEFEGKIKLVKVNTDENLKLAQRFSISALPSILIFKNGEPVERLVSLMPKSALITNITKHL
ncbi:thioredoxin [bacterium]|nr:thioredoxin [bacterium]